MAASKGVFGRGNRKSSRGGSGAEKRLCEVWEVGEGEFCTFPFTVCCNKGKTPLLRNRSSIGQEEPLWQFHLKLFCQILLKVHYTVGNRPLPNEL